MTPHPRAPAQDIVCRTCASRTWACRFHPIDWFHEVGCPHRTWTDEELASARQTEANFRAQQAKEHSERYAGVFAQLLNERGIAGTQVEQLRAQLATLTAERDEARRLHQELMFQVGKTYPGETCHETAKRYIQQHEELCGKGGPAVDRRHPQEEPSGSA